MNSIIKIKALLLLLCLFIGTDAVFAIKSQKLTKAGSAIIEYQPTNLQTNAKKDNQPFQLIDPNDCNRYCPQQLVGIGSEIRRGFHPNTVPHHNFKNIRVKALQGDYSFIQPSFYQVPFLIHYTQEKYFVFFRCRYQPTTFVAHSQRGPPTVATA